MLTTTRILITLWFSPFSDGNHCKNQYGIGATHFELLNQGVGENSANPCLEFTDFVEKPAQFKGQYIGVKGYYVEGLPQLYRDKEFHEYVSDGSGFDSTKFDYLHIIEIPKYHKTKRPPSLEYLEGADVIVYGRPTHLDLADKPIRYGGYLKADSVVLQKSP